MKQESLARVMRHSFAVCLIVFACCLAARAQTNEFTYQGRLTDNNLPPTSFYDFEFRLFSAETGGAAIATLQRLNVSVTNGTFTVQLDFGAIFDGADRWLEIAVRPAGGTSFTTLSPRQPVTSAPYSIRSLSAANSDTVGGVAASGFIQNTTMQQAGTNFNIGGNGTVGGTLTGNVINAQTQYSIGGSRVLGVSSIQENLFVGLNSGTANTSGGGNSFVGTSAGQANTTGFSNSFFGRAAGQANTTGAFNSFFGRDAGLSNTTGGANSFFGGSAGQANLTGSNNSFFGRDAGFFNTTGGDNSLFGASAGFSNTEGARNSFFGASAGISNTTGGGNSFFGSAAGFSNSTGFSNSFFGRDAGLSNTTGTQNSFFGTLAGQANTTGFQNSFFGLEVGSSNTTGGGNSFFGTTAGFFNTTGDDNSFFGVSAGALNTTGSNNSFFGRTAGFSNTTGSNNTIIGVNADVGAGDLTFATALGAGASVSTSNTIALGRANGSDKVRIFGLGVAGSDHLCRNLVNEISSCSSSLRYKTNVASFNFGLSLISQLRPISFDWKAGGMRDVGFGAEDVARINPLFVSFNSKGEVEGVKYDRLSVLFVNAFREQQTQIEAQRARIEQQQQQLDAQQRQIEGLRRLVCAQNPSADVCKEGK